MKHLNKLLILVLSITMILGLTACGDSGKSDGAYPEDKVKIGVVTFDTAGDQFIALKEYFDYLSTELNIEIVYSESISNAEGELAFIESAAAAGCKGIIGYYNVARSESIQLAIDKGMYYFGVAEEDEVYNKFKDNSMYLGGLYNDKADYDSGYAMGKALADAGCKKVIYSAGGRDFGIKMFIDRADGFMAAIQEAGGVEVVDVSGFPGTDAFSSAQTAALATPGVDGLASSFGIGVWLQPVGTAGMMGTLKLAGIDAVNGMYVDLFASGSAVCTVAEATEGFAAAIPMILNALDENADVNQDGGVAARLLVPRWVITNGEDYQAIFDLMTSGEYAVNADEVKSCIKALNEDATYETITSLYGDLSPSTIEARRQ